MRRIFAGAIPVAVAATAMVATLVGGTIGAASGASNSNSKPYTIYLSNNYLGNTWRIQMEKSAEEAAKIAPLKGKVTLDVVNAAGTVPAQIASLEAIIARHPAAILVDASSPAALNPVIAQACAAHIVVVNFDQPLTAPCAYRLTSNTTEEGILGAEWIAKVLHGKGNLYLDSGLPGAPLSNQGVENELGVFKHYPGIHVVGYYQSQYAIGPEQQGVASLLAAHPDVNGILSEAYCTGAINALQAAGHALVPMYCQSFNGTMVALATDKGAEGYVTANPPYLSADAMRIAVQVLGGQMVQKHQLLPIPCYYTEGPLPMVPGGVTCQKIKVGVNAFPNESPGLTLPASPSWTSIPASTVTP